MGIASSRTLKIRDVSLILGGAIVLVFKSEYAGPIEPLVHAYFGNLAVSFSLYFLALQIPLQHKFKKFISAGIALVVVELFEVLDGFGIMSNTYDPIDLIANVAGVTVALALDTIPALNKQTATRV